MPSRDGSRTRFLPRRTFLGLLAASPLAYSLRAQTPPPNANDETNEPTNLNRQTLLEAIDRGLAWIVRHRQPDGTFQYGWIPELNRPLPGDNALRQAGTVAALAHAARLRKNRQALEIAAESCDLLLKKFTEIDEDQRRPIHSGPTSHPLGLGALLLLALAELADAGVEKSEEAAGLAKYLAARVRDDGSFELRLTSIEEERDDVGIDFYPGEALYALAKCGAAFSSFPIDVLAILENAYPYYRRHWRANANAAFTPWQSGAFGEAYQQTKRTEYLQFVHAMNDWLLQLQYTEEHEVPEEFVGGFGVLEFGRLVRIPPGVATASSLESLAHALRAARLAGDGTRTAAYERALERGIRFLLNLQYSERNTEHFQPWLAEKLDGAFFADVEDGAVRVDYAQHALYALCLYLESKAAPPAAESKAGRSGTSTK